MYYHNNINLGYSVSYVAGKFARSLRQQLIVDSKRAEEKHKHMYKFDDKEVICAEIAGLCHDLGEHHTLNLKIFG